MLLVHPGAGDTWWSAARSGLPTTCRTRRGARMKFVHEARLDTDVTKALADAAGRDSLPSITEGAYPGHLKAGLRKRTESAVASTPQSRQSRWPEASTASTSASCARAQPW